MTDDSMIDSIIEDMYMNYPQKDANEIEFAVVGQYTTGVPWNMSISQFRGLLTGLSNLTGIEPEQTFMLTVGIDSDRVRIEDLSDIHKFCLKGEVPMNAKFETKVRARDPIDMPEYGLRLRYANESKMSFDAQMAFRDRVRDKSTVKFYRHAQRYSIISPKKLGRAGQIRMDFTSIRQGPGVDFRASRVTGPGSVTNDKYEVELEISNLTQDELAQYQEEIRMELRFYLGYLLRALNGGITISKTSDNITSVNKYLNLVSTALEVSVREQVKDLYLPTLMNLAPSFVTVNIMTLNMKHIANDANDNSVLMGSGDEANPVYTFTDKADGQRSLLFIDETGKATIFMKGTIKTNSDSGSISPILTITATGLTYPATLGNSLLDGEFLWNKDRPFFLVFDVLINTGKNITQTDFSERVKLLDGFNIKAPSGLSVRAKKFYPYTVSTFNALLDKQPPVIIRHMDANQLVGLEYRSSDDLVYNLDGLVFQPISGPGSYFPLGKGTWHTVFKWKPSYMATLDLLVTYDGQGHAPTVTKTHEPTKLEEQGYSLTYAVFKAYPNSGTRIATPSPYMCCAKVIDGIPRTEPGEDGKPGEPIRKGMIVECRLAFENVGTGEFHWAPVRIRHDKSQPNHIKVYTDLVNTIIKEPITLDHLKMKGGGRGGSKHVIVNTVNRNISNRYITDQVLARLSEKHVSILDLGCGTLKSANSWTELTKRKRTVNVLGVDLIDVSQANIHLQSYMKKFKSTFVAKFVHGNFNSDFKSQPAVAKDLATHGTYNVVTCTFAMHYAMASEDTWRTYVRNVARNLSMGGLFIGAYMNKNLILADMRKQRGGVLGSAKYWQIKIVPPSTLDSAEETTFGAAITISFTELYQDNLEYFISLDDPVVRRIMAEEGLALLEHKPFNNYMDEANRVKAEIEKQWLSYHYSFTFKKTTPAEALKSLTEPISDDSPAPEPVSEPATESEASGSTETPSTVKKGRVKLKPAVVPVKAAPVQESAPAPVQVPTPAPAPAPAQDVPQDMKAAADSAIQMLKAEEAKPKPQITRKPKFVSTS